MSLSKKFYRLFKNDSKIDVCYLLVKFFCYIGYLIIFIQSTYDEFIIRKKRFIQNYHRRNQLTKAQTNDSPEYNRTIIGIGYSMKVNVLFVWMLQQLTHLSHHADTRFAFSAFIIGVLSSWRTATVPLAGRKSHFFTTIMGERGSLHF